MTTLTVADLTQSTLDGTGVFDVLMRANKAHLDSEFDKNRIKGSEYATVYLGSLQAVMQTAMTFLLQREKIELEGKLLAQQILLGEIALQKAAAELLIIEASLAKVPAEIAHITAQTAVTTQQKLNLIAEAFNIPKQGLLLEAQVVKLEKDALVATEEVLIAKEKVLVSKEEVKIATAKLANVPKEGVMLDKQALQVTQQTTNLVATALNIPKEGLVLDGQKCKLDAEFDLLQSQNLKSLTENSLLGQKVVTERAQTTALGVDADSVVGRQKELYMAQKEGFSRDAEQKAAGIMVGTWNARRMTDEATIAGATNQLDDATIGRSIAKLMAGVGA